MQEKVKDVQKYLEKHWLTVTETTIVNAAIDIATRWGGKGVFACEFRKEGER